MTYAVITDYRAGMPQTRKNTLPYRLIACHDTEGGTGLTGAGGTIGFLVNRADRNASYHEIWAWDGSAFVAIRIVPPTSCAHSLNPGQPPIGPYEPDAWVRAGLADGWRDPNQGVYAVSLAGRVADVNRWAADPAFVAHCQRRIGEIRAELPTLVGLAEHFRFQPSNRTDWGRELTPRLGGLSFNGTLPDTGLEDSMNIVKDIVRFNAPRRWTARRQGVINGYDGRSVTPAKSVEIAAGSGADGLAIVTISGDAIPLQSDGSPFSFVEVSNGVFAGLYVPLHAVNIDTAPPQPDCSTAVEAERERWMEWWSNRPIA